MQRDLAYYLSFRVSKDDRVQKDPAPVNYLYYTSTSHHDVLRRPRHVLVPRRPP